MTGDRTTAAGLLLPHFFIVTEEAEPGDGHAHAQARMILDEMKRLVGDSAAWPGLFERLYHEKRAVSFLMEGTGGARPLSDGRSRLESAREEYALALGAAHGKRDVLKVRGGLALVSYLLRSYDEASPVSGARSAELDETKEILASAIAAKYRDVVEWAAVNAGVMGRGELEGWTPYEVL